MKSTQMIFISDSQNLKMTEIHDNTERFEIILHFQNLDMGFLCQILIDKK